MKTGTSSRPRARRRSLLFAAAFIAVGLTSTTAVASSASAATGPWSGLRLPLPQNNDATATSVANAVSCPSAAFCVAVGVYTLSGSLSQTEYGMAGLIATYSGGIWTPTQAPVPTGAEQYTGVDLTGVSCVSATLCMAVGQFTTTSSESSGQPWEPLVASYSNGVWTTAPAPLPPDATNLAGNPSVNGLESVSCLDNGGFCEAVGQYVSTTVGDETPLAETFANGAWTADGPTKAGVGYLAAVSCSATNKCEAAGAGANGPLIDTFNGTWTPIAAPIPSNAANPTSAVLTGISCPPGGLCSAVGSYSPTGGQVAEFMDSKVGSRWVTSKVQKPLKGSGFSVAVSCTDTSCTAVTEFGKVAVRSSGTTYLVPEGTIRSSSNGISCPASSPCVIAAYSRDSTYYIAKVFTQS